MRAGRRHNAKATSGRSPFTIDAPEKALPLRRPLERFPYVPSDPAKLAENCYEAYNIQVQGLAKRLQATGTEKVVIGVSGGLDSTQALLVCSRAMDRLGLPHANILAYTLPGFATSEGTKGNAWALMRALGVSAAEIDIRPAARQMLADLDHPFADGEPVYDVTFENVQAGLRTDYLFRLANHNRALVVGTGDLSELGLGWCTYGVGDQMSHYNVNASVSKTLIQHLIRFVAASGDVDPGDGRHPPRDPGNRDLTGARAAGRRRSDPVDGGHDRPLPAPGLQPVLPYALRVPALEDRLFVLACLERCRVQATWPSHIPAHEQRSYRSRRDQALAAGVLAAVLHEPVQTDGDAERAEDLVGRFPFAAGRLAGAV